MSLEAFLNKFNSPDGKYAYAIDPLKTFKVYVKFNTGSTGAGGGGSSSPLIKGIQSIVNNATGGLFNRLANSSKSTISKDGHADIASLVGQSLIDDGSGNMLDLTYFTQEGIIPQISVIDGETSETLVGNIKTHKMMVEPDNKTFSLKILNTRTSIIDRIMYPWMREITYPYWSYQDYPYTTATITIDFSEHNDIAYVFLGARPIQIEPLNPTNALDTNMSRSVTFAFDFMYIMSQGKNSESIKDTIKNTVGGIINKAAATIGL